LQALKSYGPGKTLTRTDQASSSIRQVHPRRRENGKVTELDASRQCHASVTIGASRGRNVHRHRSEFTVTTSQWGLDPEEMEIMSTRTTLFLSAAIVLSTASLAFAAGENQANEAALSRIPVQQQVGAPDAYAMFSRATHARRSTTYHGIRPNLADRQSAWYRL